LKNNRHLGSKHPHAFMPMYKSSLIALIIVAVVLMFAGDSSLAIDSRGYYPEDWVSYTKTRFVRSIAIGFYNVYFGTTGGILRYDKEIDKWLDPITSSDGLPDQNIDKLAVDPEGTRVWALTPSGVYMFETAFEEWYPADEFPYEYYRNDLGQIRDFQRYIPPFGYHIMAPYSIQDDELREYQIVAAAEGKWGDIWIGTWGMGMGRIPRYGVDLKLMNFGLYSEDCRTMLKDGDKFYFAGRNEYGAENALTIWDREKNLWSYVESRYTNRFISDQINDIHGVGNDIFLATDFGLVRMNREGKNFRSYAAPGYLQTDLVLSLAHNKDILFLGTDRGMYMLDVKNDSMQYMGGSLIGNGAVFDILYYKNDLWIGSEYGAVRYDFETQRFYRYSSSGGVLLGLIIDVEKDTEDGIWFAGEDAVVWMDDRFDEKERFYVDGELDGFRPNKILVDERYLWVGTDYGLYRWDRMKHYWKHFLMDDGLIDNQVFDLILDGDYLWIATANGVTRYYWNNPVRIEDF
jgi:ligand-binding sensor domain-containing protein